MADIKEQELNLKTDLNDNDMLRVVTNTTNELIKFSDFKNEILPTINEIEEIGENSMVQLIDEGEFQKVPFELMKNDIKEFVQPKMIQIQDYYDLNNLNDEGIYYCKSGSPANSPENPFIGGMKIIVEKLLKDSTLTINRQICIIETNGNVYYRQKNGTAWLSWNKFLTDSSTDYIISDSNGVTKWKNGRMEINTTLVRNNIAPNVAYGNSFRGSFTINFPTAFVGNPTVTLGLCKMDGTSSYGTLENIYNNRFTAYIKDDISRNAGAYVYISYQAVGKWK